MAGAADSGATETAGRPERSSTSRYHEPADDDGRSGGRPGGRGLHFSVTADDRTRLLYGPYRPPRLRRGDRAFCLYRDGDVVITSWSNARIPWPLYVRLGGRAKPGPLVNETLVAALRREASVGLQHWFGVSMSRLRPPAGTATTPSPPTKMPQPAIPLGMAPPTPARVCRPITS
jgi:hypothetical protein